MSKNTLILGGLLLASAAGAFAGDITAEAYPDADVVLVDELERVTYATNGTYETWGETWTKILTEKGRREESQTSLSYSKRYGMGEIVSVGLIGADGKERPVDVSKTTKESTDNGSMAANIYDPLDRKIVCTIPGIKVGDTLHVKTHRKTFKPRTEGKWADISVMEWSCPVVRSRYEVTSPAGLPIRRKAVRHALGNIVETSRALADGSVVHTFVATNSPQCFPEPDMPPLYTQVQNVRLSTAENWPEISKWYWNLCLPHISKTNAAMVAKVAEIGRDIRALFKFVSQEVRYMGLTMEDTSPGYAPHDVNITFDNRYGVCRDKAGLLVAMLRLAGFRAFPVLIHVGAKLDPEVPQPFFNHAIVAVETEAGKPCTLMDPTNENTKDLFPAYLCNNSYLVCRPEGDDLRVTPLPDPTKNSVDVTSKGSLAKDGAIVLESDIRFLGVNDTAYRGAFARRKPEDRVKLFDKLVKAVSPGAELLTCDITPRDIRDTEKPLAVRLVAKLPEAVLEGKSRDELTVPLVSKGLGFVNFLLAGNTSLEKRRFPLVLDTTARVKETLSLDLGETLGTPLALPPALHIAGGYAYDRVFTAKKGILTVERALTIGEVEFAPDAYLGLRENIKRVEAAERRRPTFARDPLKEADVRLLVDASETTLLSDRSWVTTNVCVKEILTYAGKRGSAELKFSYNPTWKRVEVLSATVSNRNGRVASVSAKEMNVMDCGWAAAAPRYPAAKTLVVNLPSVEVGSVISLKTAVTVTNAPAPFYATFAFDSHEPVDFRRVRVGDWVREVRGLKRLPNEPGQPAAAFWRDEVVISKGRFAPLDLKLSTLDPACLKLGEKPSVKALRDWMAKHVKVVGPSLYDLPLALQLTAPARVVAERYATRLDYVRTLAALLRGAGLKADVVLVNPNADEPEILKRRDRVDKPNVRAFATALCRVTDSGRTLFLGTENEYTPLGATAFDACEFLDPADASFGLVTSPDPDLAPYDLETDTFAVRENGAVDITVENVKKGPSVGGFRRKYAEILPEDRSRLHQALLGAVAQAATATSELEADFTSYPARRRFACLVPDYATVEGDAITLQLPAFACPIPSFTGTCRRTPFGVSATNPSDERVIVTFPAGYTEIEHLPESFAFADPDDPAKTWHTADVETSVSNDVLTVSFLRKTFKRPDRWFGANRFELIRDWRRIATSRANRTIVVRKAPASRPAAKPAPSRPAVRHLTEKEATRLFLSPSNNSSGWKNVAFPFIGQTNVVFDGAGATFVCHGRVFPFAALGCTNVTFRNFTLISQYPSCAGFTVVEKDDAGFVTQFDAGVCPYVVKDGHIDFNLDGHVVSTRKGRLSFHALDRIAIHYLMAPNTPGDKSKFPSTFVAARAEDAGHGRIRWRYIGDPHPKSVKLPYRKGEKVVINLEEGRFRDAFFFQDCARVVLENVTIRRLGGMGIVAQRSGDITVRGLVVEPEKGERVTLTADIMQFINCFGDVTIENCRCGYSLDDVINIHGNYLRVEKVQGRVVRLRAMHNSHGGFFPYRAGDALEFVEARSRDVRARAKVVSFAPSATDRYVCDLTVDANLPALPAETLVENVSLNPNVTLRNNHFHDHPNMRLSGRGRYLIERNVIADSCSGIVGLDLAEYWYESGRIADMTIRDNVFRNCNKLGGGACLTFGVSGWGANAPKIHGRIVLRNNRFEGLNRAKWNVSGVRDFQAD